MIDSTTGEIICDLIYSRKEKPEDCTVVRHPDDELKKTVIQFTMKDCVPRQQCVFRGGVIRSTPTLQDVRDRSLNDLGQLHWTYKRLKSPHVFKVGLSDRLFQLRKDMITGNKLINR